MKRANHIHLYAMAPVVQALSVQTEGRQTGCGAGFVKSRPSAARSQDYANFISCAPQPPLSGFRRPARRQLQRARVRM